MKIVFVHKLFQHYPAFLRYRHRHNNYQEPYFEDNIEHINILTQIQKKYNPPKSPLSGGLRISPPLIRGGLGRGCILWRIISESK
jgi:hypothetical protein